VFRKKGEKRYRGTFRKKGEKKAAQSKNDRAQVGQQPARGVWIFDGAFG
jgi:hypothetical protein